MYFICPSYSHIGKAAHGQFITFYVKSHSAAADAQRHIRSYFVLRISYLVFISSLLISVFRYSSNRISTSSMTSRNVLCSKILLHSSAAADSYLFHHFSLPPPRRIPCSLFLLSLHQITRHVQLDFDFHCATQPHRPFRLRPFPSFRLV